MEVGEGVQAARPLFIDCQEQIIFRSGAELDIVEGVAVPCL